MVSDLGSAAIKGSVNFLIAVGSSYGSTILISDNYWGIPATTNWRFAENSEPSVRGNGIHDTGHAYRAFLPFEDEQQRANLREYKGPADILDFRVVCASPSFTDLVLVSLGRSQTLVGNLSISESYPMLQNTPTNGSLQFVCLMANSIQSLNGTVSGLTTLCYVGAYSTVLLENPLIDPVNTPEELGGNDLRVSKAYLILDFIYNDMMHFWANNGNISTGWVTRTDGSWSVISDGRGEEMLRVSGCFTNQGNKVFEVEMASPQDGPEPRLSWDRRLNMYNTTDSRQQLGASTQALSLQDRGLLTFNPRKEWHDINATKPAAYASYLGFMTNAMSWSTSVPDEYKMTHPFVFLSNNTLSDGNQAVHGLHFALFQETLRESNSPALALQALLTRICQMI